MDNPKIYYCIAGFRQFVVPKDNIIERDGLLISAIMAFSVDPQPSVVRGVQGSPLTLGITPMPNAFLQCSFICDLREDDPLYKEMIKVLGQERKVN